MMDDSEYKKIIEFFRYSREDRALFPFIDAYMKRIDIWLRSHYFTDEQLFRYMIAGWFLMYKASIHQGSNFTTDLKEWSCLDKVSDIQKEKAKVFNRYYGKAISITNEYVVLLGLADKETLRKLALMILDKNNLRKLGNKLKKLHEGGLYEFVINGQY